ncbi:flagellar biosynthesis regulator FlaF [Varunaivibrio sulfuroxidans]|uniref:Flagellar protein FlaF n=1 Tax=Varunaivibrio sulfuroxidans TaxID=1773489 RepID=A0A4V2UNQ9_9PROT|nr:flagellar biosynthesis regulator FlaF [Varunaivibrio sulfuroxidans]TCS63001.1 flagellar protein FlaF [Varunaivibrio sulfuroxidans]WES31921.1 flagellar biosynthesis regulator FlaF [Varunaivibrio sulfuroxidans]
MNSPKKTSGYPGSGYGNVPNSGNPRYTEAWALIEAARRMSDAADKQTVDDKAARDLVRETLRLNWRLWTIFQTELSLEDDGAVPVEIRQNMLSLCNFVDKHTVETISSPHPEKVMVLVEINRNIASGLLDSIRNNPAPKEPQPQEAQAQEERNEPLPNGQSTGGDDAPKPTAKAKTPPLAAPLSFDEDI